MQLLVHVADRPGYVDSDEKRIVQPCKRCGLVLRDFDQANPPMMSGPGPHEFAWWPEDENVAQSWTENGPANPGFWFQPTDNQLLEDPEFVLCSNEMLPDDAETFWALEDQHG